MIIVIGVVNFVNLKMTWGGSLLMRAVRFEVHVRFWYNASIFFTGRGGV